MATTAIDININNHNNDSQEQLLAGQQQYFPTITTPRSFWHFEKTDVTHYLTSIKWVSLKWFTIMRFIFTIMYILFTPVLIWSHLCWSPRKASDDSDIHTKYFFLTPFWILHCCTLLFYIIMSIATIKRRTLLKQIHEYTQQLDPIPTTIYLKFAHILYVLFITFQPIYITFQFVLLESRSNAIFLPTNLAYTTFVFLTIFCEITMNNIKLLSPHLLFIYLFGIPYLSFITILYKYAKMDIQMQWFTYWPRSHSKYPFITTAGIFFTVLNLTILLYICYRQLRHIKKERKKIQPQESVYFFNTSEHGTNLKLPTGVTYHIQLETTIASPSR